MQKRQPYMAFLSQASHKNLSIRIVKQLVNCLYCIFVFVFRGICCVLTTYHLYYPSFLQCCIIQGGMARFNTEGSYICSIGALLPAHLDERDHSETM